VRLLWQATAAGEQLTVEASDMPRQATAAGDELAVEASECQQLKNIMRCNHLPQAGHHKRRFR